MVIKNWLKFCGNFELQAVVKTVKDPEDIVQQRNVKSFYSKWYAASSRVLNGTICSVCNTNFVQIFYCFDMDNWLCSPHLNCPICSFIQDQSHSVLLMVLWLYFCVSHLYFCSLRRGFEITQYKSSPHLYSGQVKCRCDSKLGSHLRSHRSHCSVSWLLSICAAAWNDFEINGLRCSHLDEEHRMHDSACVVQVKIHTWTSSVSLLFFWLHYISETFSVLSGNLAQLLTTLRKDPFKASV